MQLIGPRTTATSAGDRGNEKHEVTHPHRLVTWSTIERLTWVFVITSFVGLIIETIYHLAVYGELQSRVGLVLLPLSPIYGAGGVAMVLASDYSKHLSLPVSFVIFAVLGALVEVVTASWMESSIGMMSWDYSDLPLPLAGGKTSVVVMAIWGVMGVVCMKVVVPALDEHLMPLVATVPMATKVLVAVLVVDIVLTIVAENCWSLRMEGVLPETPVQKAFALLFSDEFMARRFASMWQIAA